MKKYFAKYLPVLFLVKEGDEFNLSDLNPLSAAAIEHKKLLSEPIRIKGPCGHFH